MLIWFVFPQSATESIRTVWNLPRFIPISRTTTRRFPSTRSCGVGESLSKRTKRPARKLFRLLFRIAFDNGRRSHWGNELETSPDANQITLAHLAIDEGADLVLGHH
ncbi:MAG: CapA family protein, partial [Thermoguttaceae bacterium]|nr:CapA family protein [Thermoguttaceae bacterium]